MIRVNDCGQGRAPDDGVVGEALDGCGLMPACHAPRLLDHRADVLGRVPDSASAVIGMMTITERAADLLERLRVDDRALGRVHVPGELEAALVLMPVERAD